MAIRINLLAEAQAEEELRRRDPAKRVLWAGVVAAALVLAWSSSLQLQRMIAKGDLNSLNAQLAARTNEFQVVLGHEQMLTEVNTKLEALQQLATNRMLHGTLLDALQHTTLDDVQLMRLRTDFAYVLNEASKAKTNTAGRLVPAKPASISERVTVTLEARDSGSNPGDRISSFRRVLGQSPYVHGLLGATNEVRLASLSPPIAGDGKPFVLFTLECRLPEKTR